MTFYSILYKQYNLNRRHTVSDFRKDITIIKCYFCEDTCVTGWDKITYSIILQFAKSSHSCCFRNSLWNSNGWKATALAHTGAKMSVAESDEESDNIIYQKIKCKRVGSLTFPTNTIFIHTNLQPRSPMYISISQFPPEGCLSSGQNNLKTESSHWAHVEVMCL